MSQRCCPPQKKIINKNKERIEEVMLAIHCTQKLWRAGQKLDLQELLILIFKQIVSLQCVTSKI